MNRFYSLKESAQGVGKVIDYQLKISVLLNACLLFLDGDDIGADQEGKLVRNTYVNSQLICHESRTFYQKTLSQKTGSHLK